MYIIYHQKFTSNLPFIATDSDSSHCSNWFSSLQTLLRRINDSDFMRKSFFSKGTSFPIDIAYYYIEKQLLTPTDAQSRYPEYFI